MRKFGIDDTMWFNAAQERVTWRMECKKSLAECTKMRVDADSARRVAAAAAAGRQRPQDQFICDICQRYFRKWQDITRHKCQTTRNCGGGLPR